MFNFSGSVNGYEPYGSLVSDGTYLYGMTQYGGTNNTGVIFKIKSDGTGYVKLLDFTGLNGSYPWGSLIYDGTFLYGMTQRGGISQDGTIFKIKPDGTGYFKILDFANTNANMPYGSLIYDGTFLYGMAQFGGTNNYYGIVFKINPNGSGYTNILNFAGTTNGSIPLGSLIYDGTFLYGMTNQGGTNNIGTIFKIQPNGTGYLKILDFIGTNGSSPYGSLIYDGTFLYGMTYQGGLANQGTMFKVKPDGSGYYDMLDFSGAKGGYPYGSLVSDGTFLYGMTSGGGTVFKYNTSCNPVTFSQTLTICPGQNISVGSHTYTSSGTYTDLFPNGTSTGCDSTVTTNLTVLSSNIFTWSPVICQGQNLAIGVHTYTANGIYTDTLTSFHGCDSTVITHLTVLLSSSTTSNTIVTCSSQSQPIHVGTDIYTTSGTYTYSYNGGGCDSTIITNLTINPSPTVSISGLSAICIGDNTNTTLTAVGNGSLLWSNGSTADSIVVSPTTPTTYSVSATLGSCKDSATTTVAVNQPPTGGFFSGLSSCCNHASFIDTSQTFMGDSIVAWNWTFALGYPSTSNAQYASVYLNQGYDTVCLIVTSLHGCKDTVCKVVFEPFASVEKFNNSSAISVYPNPTSSNLQIRIVGANKALTEVFVNDLLGKETIKCTDIKTQNGIMQLDVSGLPVGVYFIKTNLGTQKFIKQ